MSWSEVKKINDNMNMSLDQLFVKLMGGFHREYIYSSRTYEIPWDGVYTIRAYCGNHGQYGKVVKKFTKGELLTINMTNNTSLSITSNKQANSIFHINLTGANANVNSNSSDSIRAVAIGGEVNGSNGGIARVRSNNGIAAGGGGFAGYNGGDAYAWGTNCYALGGGGGGSNNVTSNVAGGVGGSAYINGTALSSYCCTTSLTSGKGYNGGNSHNSSSYHYGGEGGDGGCGGGCGYNRIAFNTSSTDEIKNGGVGYFSDGGYMRGGSARGGEMARILYDGRNYKARQYSNLSGKKGYFVGGDGYEGETSGSHGGVGGEGGFLGGNGGNGYRGTGTRPSINTGGGNGGFSAYGIGGIGGTANSSNNTSVHSGTGGTGKLLGGNGGENIGNFAGGNGGNGFIPGAGGVGSTGLRGETGFALTSSVMTSSFPLKGMTPYTSVVIIEAGDSLEDF